MTDPICGIASGLRGAPFFLDGDSGTVFDKPTFDVGRGGTKRPCDLGGHLLFSHQAPLNTVFNALVAMAA
jgi:hypothetical protein